jgi:hypothetical protein
LVSSTFSQYEQEVIVELLTAATKKTKTHIPVIGMESQPVSNDDDKYSRIAERAYFKAEARGYEPGHEIQDWLDAEAEIEAGTVSGKS